ncbi:hypothetical protein K7X08_015965 [Anisodus acutangulus]|uniref:Uncharacterized protein n=1 Tax=Anisodus acutangulus TaxID=402998 RepID=A0A9Q1QXK4_9SOLA|nr:hypothetical protein K7X08_015965 [Anisodus acutangulus]
MQVRLYDFKHSDLENFHFITDTKSEVHELAQGQGPTCRAVLKLLDVRVRAIEFVNHGAKLAIGNENAKGDIKSVCKVKLDKPCCWTTTFMKEGKVCGLLLLFQNGDIEIRVGGADLFNVSFKVEFQSSRENGHITLANGSELASVSLLASENDFRIPESLPSLHDEVLEAAADAAMKFSTQKKKQGGGPNIDDIEIDEPVPMASTSSHNTQNSKRVTEREKFLDSEGDDAKPRLRTREEIIAKYRKAGDASSAAGQARDKLLERQEKLERINQRTEELRSGLKTLHHWQMSLSR